MSTLFLVSAWPTFIEIWTHRMIEMLEPNLKALATYAPIEPYWQGRIPVVELDQVPAARWRRGARRLGLPIDATPDSPVLRRMVESEAVSKVLVNYLNFALRFTKIWTRTSKPLFVLCHGFDTTWDYRIHEAPDKPCFGPEYINAVKTIANKAILITSSKCGAKRLIDVGVPPDRVIVKYIGVPIPQAPAKRSHRTKEVEILFLGRLVDCKGPDLVIRAFDLACENGMDARLTIAGDGPMRTLCEKLREVSRFRERIRFLGAVDAINGEKLRETSDIFTAHNCLGRFTHQEEVYGVSFVEAMAATLPVISGRSGGLTETVIDGHTGILFEPGDIEKHAEALLQLAQNPDLRHSMGLAGWLRAKNYFSLENEQAELRNILGYS